MRWDRNHSHSRASKPDHQLWRHCQPDGRNRPDSFSYGHLRTLGQLCLDYICRLYGRRNHAQFDCWRHLHHSGDPDRQQHLRTSHPGLAKLYRERGKPCAHHCQFLPRLRCRGIGGSERHADGRKFPHHDDCNSRGSSPRDHLREPHHHHVIAYCLRPSHGGNRGNHPHQPHARRWNCFGKSARPL